MRGVAYVVAAIAAAGIVIGIANYPETPDSAPASVDASAVAEADPVMAEAGTLTLSVPKMHCVFACYPKVKETLESFDAVREVELAEQKEEGVIDNRQVIVKYDSGFDLSQAIAKLDKEGFDDSALAP